jgi:hypothetical protein
MSNWLSKSNQSFSIANDTSSTMLNNRVHCYYYGCVQHMFHVLHIDKKMSETEISDNCNPNINKGNGGTHTWLAKFFFEDLQKQSHVFEGLALSNKVGLLKRLRTDADYSMSNMQHSDLNTAKEHSDKIISILLKRYKK